MKQFADGRVQAIGCLDHTGTLVAISQFLLILRTRRVLRWHVLVQFCVGGRRRSGDRLTVALNPRATVCGGCGTGLGRLGAVGFEGGLQQRDASDTATPQLYCAGRPYENVCCVVNESKL